MAEEASEKQKGLREQIHVDGAKIRALRQERGWTQKELLLRSLVDQSTISYLESGRNKAASIRTMVALARAFGVSVDDLFVPPTNPTPVPPPDPQLERIKSLLKDLTPAELDQAIDFARFILARRRRAKYSKRKLEKRRLLEK